MNDQPDLFDVGERQIVPLAEWKQAKRGPCVPAPLGTGPEGETCKTCKHYTIRKFAGSYRKCGLMQKHWTHGAGSDIKASWPACKEWKS